MVLSLGCWGISALVPEKPLLLLHPLTLVFPLLFLTLPAPTSLLPDQYVLPYSKNVVTEAPLMGQPPASSHKDHPYSPPATKTLPNTTNTAVHMWVHHLIASCSFLFFPGSCRDTAMKTGRACDDSSNIGRENQ